MDKREFHLHTEAFYKYQAWIFRIMGLWKLSDQASLRLQKAYKIYFYYILFFWVLSFDFGCFIQFTANISDLNEVIKVFFIFATSLGVFAKYASIKWKNHQYAQLVQKLHQPIFMPLNAREARLFRASKNLSETVRNGYGGMSWCTLNVLLLTQYMVDNTELPMSLYNPFNIDTKLKYVLMYIYQYLAVSVLCYMNIAFDSISASLMIHIKGQIDILCDRLENLHAPEGKQKDQRILLQLKDCIRYYGEILDLTLISQDLISLPISMQIACSVLVLVANFYAMSFLSDPGDYANFFKFAIYQLCMLSQIYILCYFPSEVTTRSQDIAYHLYSSNWVHWDAISRKLTLLMLTRFAIPIRIRSINPTYTFNLAAFTSIVNSSYSYFALLKRFNS